jgi:hypothetical protein
MPKIIRLGPKKRRKKRKEKERKKRKEKKRKRKEEKEKRKKKEKKGGGEITKMKAKLPCDRAYKHRICSSVCT